MYKNFEVVFRLFDISSNSYYPSSLYVSSNVYVSFFFFALAVMEETL